MFVYENKVTYVVPRSNIRSLRSYGLLLCYNFLNCGCHLKVGPMPFIPDCFYR